MRHLLSTIALLLISAQAFTQKVPDFLPSEYRATYRELAKEYKELKKIYDVVLPPEEQLPLMPQAYDNTEILNWGNRNLAITEKLEEIKSRAKRKIRVYIFDTAGELNHPMLKASARPGHSYTGEPSKADGNGHGTHCAGIYAAINGTQELGIARALAEKGLLEIIPVKVLTDQGSGFYSWMVAATNDMTKDAARHSDALTIFSYSLGGPNASPAFDDALKNAHDQGIVIVAAAGNGYGNGVDYPGSSQWTDAIAATTIENKRANFSDKGPEVTFGAPGQGIVSTYLKGTLRSLSGTSMATPTEGAIYAIVGSVYPQATAADIKAHLIKHVTDLPPVGKDEEFGHGLTIITRMLDNAIGKPDDPGEEPGDDDPVDDPIDEPEDPEEPGDDRPDKNSRYIITTIPTTYTVKWKHNSGKTFYDLKVKLKVRMKTKKWGDEAIRVLLGQTREHFRNRMYVVPDDYDFIDAGYAVGVFYERLMKQDYDLNVDIFGYMVIDEHGYNAQPRNVPSFTIRKQAPKVTSTRY